MIFNLPRAPHNSLRISMLVCSVKEGDPERVILEGQRVCLTIKWSPAISFLSLPWTMIVLGLGAWRTRERMFFFFFFLQHGFSLPYLLGLV